MDPHILLLELIVQAQDKHHEDIGSPIKEEQPQGICPSVHPQHDENFQLPIVEQHKEIHSTDIEQYNGDISSTVTEESDKSATTLVNQHVADMPVLVDDKHQEHIHSPVEDDQCEEIHSPSIKFFFDRHILCFGKFTPTTRAWNF